MDLITVVTNFERFRATLLLKDEAGIKVQKLEDDTQHEAGTVLYIPWHKVEYIVLSTPLGQVKDEE